MLQQCWRPSVAIVIALAWLAACAPAPIVVVPPPTLAPTAAPTPAPIRVYVSGAVSHTGVYTLPARSLVQDALQAAGGAGAEADLERINLAQELRDQQQVHVPRKGESAQPPAPAPGAGTGAAPAQGRININTATLDDLDKLPRIGPATAQRIIDYRTQHGPFKQIQDLKNVSGIGDATFDGIKDLITVGP